MTDEAKRDGEARRHDNAMRKACAEAPDQLLGSQVKAIDLILKGIGRALPRAEAVAKEVEKTAEKKPPYNDRPNQVYLIDGGRGAGKTYTLLTAEFMIRELIGTPADSDKRKIWSDQSKTVNGGRPVDVEVLRIIFPGEFTEGETLMEHVFAAIRSRLDEVAKKAKKDEDPKRQKEAQTLTTKLITEVAQGWYFAKRFGFEAVVRDAINYDDLVENWSTESGKAFQRIDAWRAFVTEWLAFSRAKLLVIMLDDSDNDADLTDSILHSLRLVLDHPQVVTVLAGNVTAMRESLLHLRMAGIAGPVSALSDGRSPAAKEWRKRLRREAEEYLEKVIPQQQRAYLSVGRVEVATDETLHQEKQGAGEQVGVEVATEGKASSREKQGDFEQIVGHTLEKMVATALSDTRKNFLSAKFDLALKHEAQKVDSASVEQQRRLEAFLSWWLFGNLYAVELRPRSVRNLHTIRDYYVEEMAKPDGTAAWRKRLPVVLYGMSANFDLVQRLTDEDPAIIPWLRQQHLRSDWSQRRAFIINHRRLPRRDYGHAFLRYQLDIGLAMPFRDNADQMVPTELLPNPVGRRHLRRFFQPRQSPRRHRRLGLARWLDHAAIPSNCLYFHDLMALPDGAFIDVGDLPKEKRRGEIAALQSGRWEGQLADSWLSAVEDDQETDADEYLARYFREIVCESLRGSEIIPAGELINLMDPPGIAEKQTKAVYEHFVLDELHSFDEDFWRRTHLMRKMIKRRFGKGDLAFRSEDEEAGPPAESEDPQAREGRERKLNFKLNYGFDPERIKNPSRMIALYASLASDLRRGWHAIRIHEVAPRLLEHLRGGGGEQELHAAVANKDRLRLYKCQSIRDILSNDEWTRDAIASLEKEQLVGEFNRYFDEKAAEPGKTPESAIKVSTNISILEKFIDACAEEIREASGPDEALPWIVRVATAMHHSKLLAILRDETLPPIAADASHDVVEATVRAHRVKWRKWALGLKARLARSKRHTEIAVAQARFRLYLRAIDINRLFEAGEGLAETAQVQEESESYDVWMWTLRNVARFLSVDWPIHDSILSQQAAPVGFGWGKDFLQILGKPKVAVAELQEHARSTRNFALFMYGLAPSLPAMIHASVMSRIYEAKLRVAGVRQHDYGPAARAIVAGSLELIGEAIDEADEWAYLIGQLSVLLRVVKIKALHLDLRLLMDAARDRDDQQANFLHAVERNPAAKAALPEGCDGKELQRICDELFAEKQNPLITGLAIFPDIAPSTLFGEEWIGDLISRRAFKEAHTPRLAGDKAASDEEVEEVWPVERSNPGRKITESSLSVTGAFGETEQWLWAANRSLRKLREQIVREARNLLPEGFDSLPEQGAWAPKHLAGSKEKSQRTVALAAQAATVLANLGRAQAPRPPAESGVG